MARSATGKAAPSAFGPPSAEFLSACDRTGVLAEHRPALWSLYRRWVHRTAEPEHLQSLLDDYSRWRRYLRARHGDGGAADEFKREWQRATRAFVGCRMPAGFAEDLAAAFFERVWRSVGEDFAWNCPFEVYLRTILANLARDALRDQQRRSRRETRLESEDGVLVDHASPAPGPEELAIQEDDRRQVAAVLAELSGVDRYIVRECLVERTAGEEVAKRLGMTRPAVYQRLYRLKKLLRERFAARRGR